MTERHVWWKQLRAAAGPTVPAAQVVPPVPTVPCTGRSVFVSHASADRPNATTVVELLERAGWACWIAPRDIDVNRSWAEAIVEGIERSSMLLLLMSHRSVESDEVYREIEAAAARRRPIMVVRIDRDVVVRARLQYFVGSLQWIDASGRPLTRELVTLPEQIAGLLGSVAVPTSRPGTPRRTAAGPVPDLDDLLRRGPRSRRHRYDSDRGDLT